jgi:hypothetical protein
MHGCARILTPPSTVCRFAEDLDITAHVDVSIRVEDDVKFFKVEAVHIDFTIGKLSLQLSNLYNGLKTLGRGEP